MIFLGFAENSIQLVPDGTLFLHIALILVMVAVLNATLFKPINRILAERDRRTRGRFGEAKETLQRVEEKMSQYERTLREARAEGYRQMEHERAQALGQRQAKLTAAREEISDSIVVEKEAIQAQTEEARRTLERDARRIAVEIGAHILRRPLNDTTVSGIGSGL